MATGRMMMRAKGALNARRNSPQKKKVFSISIYAAFEFFSLNRHGIPYVTNWIGADDSRLEYCSIDWVNATQHLGAREADMH
jgi:hypothetical protein